MKKRISPAVRAFLFQDSDRKVDRILIVYKATGTTDPDGQLAYAMFLKASLTGAEEQRRYLAAFDVAFRPHHDPTWAGDESFMSETGELAASVFLRVDPELKRNTLGQKARRLASCVWHLGPRLGWIYYRMDAQARLDPEFVPLWCDNMLKKADQEEAAGQTALASTLRSWARLCREYNDKFHGAKPS